MTGEGASSNTFLKVEEAADLLSRSPRFREEDGAFVVAIEPAPTGLRAGLRSTRGNELRCGEAEHPGGGRPCRLTSHCDRDNGRAARKWRPYARDGCGTGLSEGSV